MLAYMGAGSDVGGGGGGGLAALGQGGIVVFHPSGELKLELDNYFSKCAKILRL